MYISCEEFQRSKFLVGNVDESEGRRTLIAIQFLRSIKVYYVSTKRKVRSSGADSKSFVIHSGVRQVCVLSPALFNYIIDWIFGQALQDNPGVQVGTNAYMSNLAHADDIVLLSTNYGDMQGQLEAGNHHAATIGDRINASKANAMAAHIPGEQHQAFLLNGKPMADVDKFKYLGSMLTANGQGMEDIRSRMNLTHSAVPCLQSSLWSQLK